MEEEKKSKLKKWIILSIFAIIMIVATILLTPKFVALLNDEAERLAFKQYVSDLGFLGVLFLIGIQIVQMIFAFVPGEPIEIMAGMMYGPYLGLLVCMIGCLIGTMTIYFLIKKFGLKLFDVEKKDSEKFAFLNKQERLDTVVFILFFIPGTPKDALTYIVPFTKMKAVRFFVISTVARIPSIITSTFVGGALIEGNVAQTVIIFLVTAVISIVGIIANNIYVKRKQKSV